MAEILLVHGSGFGAWCWAPVIEELARLGRRARALDLPAHGEDRTPVAEASLAAYAAAILRRIDEPVTLVGHSAGGFPVSAAAEAAPDRIARLVFVCAYAPADGESVASMRRAAPRQPLRPAIRLAPDRATFSFDPALAGDLLFHDCPPEVRDAALARMGPEPVAPQEEPIRLTARYHGVPKHYVRCLEDRAIPPEHQAAMTAGWEAASLSTLAAGHSPFLACPAALAARLAAVVADPSCCRPTRAWATAPGNPLSRGGPRG